MNFFQARSDAFTDGEEGDVDIGEPAVVRRRVSDGV